MSIIIVPNDWKAFFQQIAKTVSHCQAHSHTQHSIGIMENEFFSSYFGKKGGS